MPSTRKILYRLALVFCVTAAGYFRGPLETKSAAASEADCEAAELIPYKTIKYNNLVCEGVLLQQSGDFKGAIDTFESALKLRLFEEPNVYLFSRLAYLYAINNNVTKAQDYISKAKISIVILLGFAKCVTDYEYTPNPNFEELFAKGKIGISKSGEMLNGDYVLPIYIEMCQENIIPFYTQSPDLDAVVKESLVALYRLAKEEVDRRVAGRSK